MNITKCPSCLSTDVCLIGLIPASNVFAGKELNRIIPGGKLWQCLHCALVFRFPRLSKYELDTLYRNGLSENWPDKIDNRIDWKLAKDVVENLNQIKTVLDIGCFDGKFLESLDNRYEKLGIEIHTEAAKRAELRGIKILGNDFKKLRNNKNIADVVLALDVIEHSEDPFDFLVQLVEAVKLGGFIIIGTGNSDALSWKFMGSAYWYSHIAEHISFINTRWTNQVADKLGLSIIQTYKYSHGSKNFNIKAKEVILNILYRISPFFFSQLRKIGFGNVKVNPSGELDKVPPYWLSANDHILYVFKKN